MISFPFGETRKRRMSLTSPSGRLTNSKSPEGRLTNSKSPEGRLITLPIQLDQSIAAVKSQQSTTIRIEEIENISLGPNAVQRYLYVKLKSDPKAKQIFGSTEEITALYATLIETWNNAQKTKHFVNLCGLLVPKERVTSVQLHLIQVEANGVGVVEEKEKEKEIEYLIRIKWNDDLKVAHSADLNFKTKEEALTSLDLIHRILM